MESGISRSYSTWASLTASRTPILASFSTGANCLPQAAEAALASTFLMPFSLLHLGLLEISAL